MFDRGARLLTTLLACFALVGGCASMRKQKIVPESIAACRQMSRDGVAAMELGQWDESRSLLREAVSTSPTDIDARRHLAEVLWQMGEHRDAVVHMEAAVRLDARNAPTIVRSGEMLLAVGAVDTAAERAQQAIALDAKLGGAWALRGRVFRHQGDTARALADLQQALRFSPHSTDVLLDTAEIQYGAGRAERCLTTLHHLLDVYAPGEEPQRALWLEGLAYQALDRPDDAIESLYAATLRGAPQADLLYQLALAEQTVGRPAEAASAVRQALSVDAEHQKSRVLLAQLEGSAAPDPGGVIRR